MTSPDNAAPVKPPPSFSPGAPLLVQKKRAPDHDQISQPSTASFTYTDSPSVQSTPRTSIASEKPSRTGSPNGRISVSQLGRASAGSPVGDPLDGAEGTRPLIIRAFSPAVAIYASPDTEQIAQEKGFKHGFREMVRPFGERVMGKVVVRDSIGAGRSWDDFGVRFVELEGEMTTPRSIQDSKFGHPLAQVEEVLERHLRSPDNPLSPFSPRAVQSRDLEQTTQSSSLYSLFLSRLLSGSTLTPHESFLHPVACVIAISSRNPSPIESLRQLYAQTSQGGKRLPLWVNPEYLRYYVLVHDEDRDDISKSTALFDQMKRHFGLHCHLLRLRSAQCVPTDDDSVPVPQCEWISPSEDLTALNQTDTLIGFESSGPCLFESDVSAIKTCVRELVAQSVVPHMENRVALWNDQVASKRRGISGRFMSMSKRWAGLGSRGSSGSSGGSGGGSSGNYDSLQGFYRPDTPEALLRKLADYSFMLRDYKLSSSTYELLRTDFNNDKAWKYHAGTHEMAAISNLLNPLANTARTKLDSIDQMLETASYSYLNRCSDPQDALRCLALGVELLRVRGGTAAEIAAKWAIRILESGLVGNIGNILVTERVAACYSARVSTSGAGWGSRKRKAALWTVLAADSWMRLGNTSLAAARLEEVDELYGSISGYDGKLPFRHMQAFLDNLRHAINSQTLADKGLDLRDEEATTNLLAPEEISEKLDYRHHRNKSLMGGSNPLEGAPLSPIRTTAREEPLARNDDFE